MAKKKMTKEEFQQWIKGKSDEELVAEAKKLLVALERNQNVAGDEEQDHLQRIK
jgi:hypothetical protein